MSVVTTLTALALVDAEGLAGSALAWRAWTALEVDAEASLRWHPAFERSYPGFRHLDRLGRACALAAEAAGFMPGARDAAETALILASPFGSLDTDRRFQASRATPTGIAAGLFPFTLPSTCLGPLAIRYGLRGPTIALSTAPGREAEGLRAAAELLAADEARACLVALGDWLPPASADELGLEPRTEVAVLHLGPGVAGSAEARCFDELVHAEDPLALVRARLLGSTH